MQSRFPLHEVKIEIGDKKRKVQLPLYKNGIFSVNRNEIAVEIRGVAYYHTSNGNTIHIKPYNGADYLMVEHFLNSWGIVSILHQRNMINFHASSFNWKGKGIMVCGDSGAGKSSLTAAFSLNGADFISDDISIVTFKNEIPYIKNLLYPVALKNEAIEQLNLEARIPEKTNPLNAKKLYHFKKQEETDVPLYHVLWINLYDGEELEFSELKGIEKFSLLRGEICGWEMLKGMRDTEALYLKQLVEISRKVQITRIDRPRIFPLLQLKKEVNAWLEKIFEEQNMIQAV